MHRLDVCAGPNLVAHGYARRSMSEANFGRLLRVLEILPPHPRTIDTTQVVSLLAGEGYQTTARTVQRDLLKLEGMGLGVECIADSRPHRWRVAEGAKPVLVPGFDVPQALALLLVEKYLARLIPRAMWSALGPHLTQAKKMVEGKPARRLLDRTRIVPRAQPVLPPGVDVTILDAVQLAVVEERQLKVRYASAGKADMAAGGARSPGKGRREVERGRKKTATSSELKLHPVGLIMRDAVVYLAATAFTYRDVRLYALHRMRAATLLAEPARKPPAGFDLDAFVADGTTGWRLASAPIELELRFFDGAERAVLESPLSKDQRAVPGRGHVGIKATVADTRVLRSWLLGFGAAVEVRKPRTVRNDLRKALQQTLARYGDDGR